MLWRSVPPVPSPASPVCPSPPGAPLLCVLEPRDRGGAGQNWFLLMYVWGPQNRGQSFCPLKRGLEVKN